MTATKPKRQRKPKEGDVLAIPLGDGTYAFGQVCKGGGSYAYFDLRSNQFLPIDEIVSCPVAFRVAMVGDSAKNGGWTILGNLPLIGPLAELASYRNQPVGSNQLYLVKGNQRIPATYDQVKDLEVMSWWYEDHVVQRLIDHFAGRPNLEFDSTRRIKVYDPKTGQEIDPETGEEIKRGPPKPSLGDANSANDAPHISQSAGKSKPATAATLGKMHEMAATYDHLIALLRATADERLTLYTESIAGSVAQLKRMLAADVDAKLGHEIVKGVREGLRETPQLLVRLVPDRGIQYVAELEKKLGRRFSDY